MTALLGNFEPPPLESIKQDDAGDWLTCQFCSLTFSSRVELKSHTFCHFSTRECSECNVQLIQICDEWFELHSTANCHNNSNFHTYSENHIDNAGAVLIKQEPANELESDQLDEPLNVKTDVDFNNFGEIFTANLSTSIETNDNNTVNATLPQHNDDEMHFLSSLNSQYTFNVINVEELNNSTNTSDYLIVRKKYARNHPHRPKMDYTCDICGKAIKHFNLLEEHMSAFHSARDSFQCRICGRCYPNRYYLRKHVARHKDATAANINECADDLDKGLMERNKYNRPCNRRKRKINLTCDECGRIFKHNYLLLEHKNSKHSGASTFQCRKCGRYYPNRYYLTKHLKRHEDAEKNGIPFDQLGNDLDEDLMQKNRYVRSDPNEDKTSFDCEECGSTFKKFYLLTEHKRSKHSYDNGFPCRKCGRRYPNRYYLTKHMKRHQNNDENQNLHSSDDDSIGFERKPNVQNHPHQPKSEFTCEDCGMIYNTFELLEEHITSNHSNKVAGFMCQICSRVYPDRDSLQNHMKKHQTKRMKKDENLDEDLIERPKYMRVHPHRPTSNLTCDICQKVLSNYYSMKDHMSSKHSGKTKVKRKCTKCNKTFVSKKSLEKHQRQKHTDVPEAIKSKVETKQMCSICGRLFPDRSKMLSHEKTHFGITISCEICGKKFLHKNYLRKHIKSVHTGVRPFSCNVDGCKWTFGYPQGLKRHQARRHGMVTHRNACPICSKEFPDSTYHLKRHLKAHANNTAKEYIPEPKPDTPQPTA